MSSASPRGELHDLIHHFVAWHESFTESPPGASALPSTEREALLSELRALAGAQPAAAAANRGLRDVVRALFQRPRADPAERERALLAKYAQVCERTPPTHVLNALLRQYQAIKQASMRDRARARLTTIASSAVRMDAIDGALAAR